MWTDVMNLKVTEFNNSFADIYIGFYPIVHSIDNPFTTELAHAFWPGHKPLNGDIHIRNDVPYSAFSDQGRELKMHGLLKVVCLSVSMSACVSVCVYV